MRAFLYLIACLLIVPAADAQSSRHEDSGAGVEYAYPGGAERGLPARLRDRVSAADFGAKCDGHSDDTAAIQRALDAMRLGGEVDLPSNVECHATNLAIPDRRMLDCRGSWLTAIGKGNAPIVLNGTTGATVRNCTLTGYNAINVAGDTSEITFERLFLYGKNAGLSVTASSDFERATWYDVSFFQGKYGFYFVPGPGSREAIADKQFFYNPHFEGQSVSAIYLDGSNVRRADTGTGSWLISGGVINNIGQDGVHITPGMRPDQPWELIGFTAEGAPGFGQSRAKTRCDATAGSPVLTGCRSTSDFTVGRQVNVAFAGSVFYQDLDAGIRKMDATTMTLDRAAVKTVRDVTVNEAEYDLLYGLPGQSIIEDVSCGNANSRYFYNGGSRATFINNSSGCGQINAGMQAMQVIGPGVSLHRSSDYDGSFWQGGSTGFDLSSLGAENYVSTPPGKDFTVSLADSKTNGGGSFGGFQVQNGVTGQPNGILRADGETGHLTYGGPPPKVSCGTDAVVQGNDNVGRLTCGADPDDKVILTFASPVWPHNNPPVCEAWDETRAVTLRPAGVSTREVIFVTSGRVVAADIIDWSCRSYF
jgi:hypothetical protein